VQPQRGLPGVVCPVPHGAQRRVVTLAAGPGVRSATPPRSRQTVRQTRARPRLARPRAPGKRKRDRSITPPLRSVAGLGVMMAHQVDVSPSEACRCCAASPARCTAPCSYPGCRSREFRSATPPALIRQTVRQPVARPRIAGPRPPDNGNVTGSIHHLLRLHWAANWDREPVQRALVLNPASFGACCCRIRTVPNAGVVYLAAGRRSSAQHLPAALLVNLRQTRAPTTCRPFPCPRLAA